LCCLFVNCSSDRFNYCDERNVFDNTIVNDYKEIVKRFLSEMFSFSKFTRNKLEFHRRLKCGMAGFKSRHFKIRRGEGGGAGNHIHPASLAPTESWLGAQVDAYWEKILGLPKPWWGHSPAPHYEWMPVKSFAITLVFFV
jgi:hypothetical protein